MSATAIERVVRDRLGLDPSALGSSALGRAVQTRMAARGITDPALYTARLMTEAAECGALAGALTVRETWFFRGGHALFDRLADFVLAHSGRPGGVRVLSAPCSTGEEPYSLAIALLDHLGGPGACAIDAIDLSEQHLARAVEGRYPASAFREPGTDPRPAHFRKSGDVWEVLPHVRAAVRFVGANLADPQFLAAEPPYDLILCRNVFIYLTPDAKQRAVANLDRLLAPDGRLCLTPAEADRLPPERFTPDGPPGSGIYRRASAEAGGPAGRAGPGPALSTTALTTALAPPPAPPNDRPAPPAPGTLAAARALADAGHLGAARAVCERLLAASPGHADALALVGVMALATGNTDAAYDAFGKALYLAPDHVEAIGHMIHLCERRGNPVRAAALRARLAKLAPGEDV